MSYTALYRKFRPNSFLDVKGQEHIVTTLKNQIKANRIGHAYLFTGTRGTGKTTVAKIFAKSVNCEHPVDGSPCGECSLCKAIASGASMNVIEIDAASNNGVDNIREIVEEVSYSPTEGKYKVYIIDEVHMLSIGAFNALLKTLEEPPSYVIFILATTEVHKIPITILSRCQRYDFKRITIDTIVDRLKELMQTEKVEVEEKALKYIAKTADGSMRDALSLLDQCIAFHLGKPLTYDLVLDVLGAVDTEVFSRLFRFILKRDVTGCISLLDEILMQGRELTQFVTDFTWYLRNLMLVKSSSNAEDVIDISEENLTKLKEEADMAEMDQILRYIRIFSELTGQIRYAIGKRVLLEITLVKLCKPCMETNQDSILERIRELEEKIENGVSYFPGANPIGEKTNFDTSLKNSESVIEKVFPKAVSEEVKLACQKWKSIIGGAENPMKMYLKDANLSVDEEGRLLVVLEEGLAADYFLEKEGNVEQLEQLVSNFLQKQVSVTVISVGTKREFRDHFFDLARNINMDIEVEE